MPPSSQQLDNLIQPPRHEMQVQDRWKKLPPDEACALYQSGWTTNRIAEKFGCDVSSVRSCLIANGVKPRTIQEAAALGRISGTSKIRFQRLSEFNDFTVWGNMAKLVAVSRSGHVHEILVDAADLPALIEHGRRWYVVRREHTNYARASNYGKTVYLHRFLMGLDALEHVDHWNHNGLDNRRDNLRHTDRSGNMLNLKRGRGKSGIRGVRWEERLGKWVARVQGVHLGVFADKESAGEAVRSRLIDLGAIREIAS